MKFTAVEEREILATVLELNVPFKIEQTVREGDMITSFIFTKYDASENLKFATVYANGMVSYDFEESILREVKLWMSKKETSNSFKEYVEYKKLSKRG